MKFPFGQNVSKLVFGVDVFDLDFRIQISSIEQPIKNNSVGSGNVSQCRAPLLAPSAQPSALNLGPITCPTLETDRGQNRQNWLRPKNPPLPLLTLFVLILSLFVLFLQFFAAFFFAVVWKCRPLKIQSLPTFDLPKCQEHFYNRLALPLTSPQVNNNQALGLQQNSTSRCQ